MTIIEALLAYLIADAIGAVYHVLTDRGWNIRSQCVDFARHHQFPETLTFDLRPMVIGVPTCFAGWLLFGHATFFAVLGVSSGLSQVTHYWTHNKPPVIAKWLQDAGVFLRTSRHDKHHGDFDRDFCVLSGWNNWWVNWLAKIIPYRRPVHDVLLFVGIVSFAATAATYVAWRS